MFDVVATTFRAACATGAARVAASEERRERVVSSRSLQNLCAPWTPRLTWNCRKNWLTDLPEAEERDLAPVVLRAETGEFGRVERQRRREALNVSEARLRGRRPSSRLTPPAMS